MLPAADNSHKWPLKKYTTQVAMIVSVLLLATASVAVAQVCLNITAQEVVEVVNPDGKKETKYIAPESILPKDVLLYSINYHNDSVESADAVVITNPIPEHMQYVDGSAGPRNHTDVVFSVDGGKSFNFPDKLFITAQNGQQRRATAKDYTHIQWRFKNSLSPGDKGTVEYRARLE